MKNAWAKIIFLTTVAVFSVSMALSGCGKTGNLYLPDEDGVTKNQKKTKSDEQK